MWQYGKKISILWTINQNRNAWVLVDSLWRRLAHDDDSVFTAMMAACTAAKTTNSSVTFREEVVGGYTEIREIYLL